MIQKLNTNEVMAIYYVVVSDFADSGDPVSPIGVKSQHLLESTVSRQFTSYEGIEKYSTPVSNAATLAYGICCNHPFHNGNKRTALVSMLCHLDKNDMTFKEEIAQKELYDFMIDIAGHELVSRNGSGDYSDEEIQKIAKWLRKWTRRVAHDERIITCRELRAILRKHGFDLENHDSNHIEVVRYKRPALSYIGLAKSTPRRERVMRIPYPRDGAQVGRNTLRDLRDKCELTDRFGVDSEAFYAKVRPADFFVNKYRKTLRSLART